MTVHHYQPQPDFGTPPVAVGAEVTLAIDGISVTVPQGTSVMRAAALAGVKLPRLCASDTLEAYGSCRMCLVSIAGRRGHPASCTTPVESGMQVQTQSEELARLRRNVMELTISDHPLDCLTCAVNGDCELQDCAGEVGLRAVRYPGGANHLDAEPDHSNPYFSFDAAKCIVCARCVRACEEVQGSFALTLQGNGFDTRVSAGPAGDILASDCVSCGACVQSCPTASLVEKRVADIGVPEHTVDTTCAYCGVGCTFRAELRGAEVVRMVPLKTGRANEGHACVKGRFAFGYVNHPERITQPMVREHIDQPWRQVSWEEAIDYAAERLQAIQQQYGRNSVGAISSSRCTNEEVYILQKMVRAALGTNNVDTCARVCHSPTGYGLKATLGESAGTQTFASVAQADVVVVIGANPTEAHPVFGSRLKRRLREGARLVVIDPRAIELVNSPHVSADHHLALRPGTNVALLNALAHVIVEEGLHDEAFIQQRCDQPLYDDWLRFIREPQHAPETSETITGVPAAEVRAAARLYAGAGNGAIYYGLGVTEHSQGSTAVMAIANLAMLTGNLGREGVGVNPLRGQNNVQGSCDMGSFPHELPGYRHVSDDVTRAQFESYWQVELDPQPGLRIPNMLSGAVAGEFRGLYCQGEDIAQSDPDTQHVQQALRSLDCLIVQDIFLNETAKFAHVFLPGATFLEKEGTFTNAERRISPVRQALAPLAGKADWQVTQALSTALGYPMDYEHPAEIMAEIAALTPTFSGVSYARLQEQGSLQWPCNEQAPQGTPTMHREQFVRGLGAFAITDYIATRERTSDTFPLLLTTGRVLSQYNVGAQTRRTDNGSWHAADELEIHPADAAVRGLADGDAVAITSRAGATVLTARLSQRMQPGVVYTTFHHPDSGANVVTTESSDWATNCPEYKVTAVQVEKTHTLAHWQQDNRQFDQQQQQLLQGGGSSLPEESTVP